MGCDFKAVRIRVETDAGPAGFEQRFNSGLTVIRGGNTIGKSLLLQSLLYGLGFEQVYATRKGTLTRAVTRLITLPDGSGHRDHAVNSSWIEVLVANDEGALLTIRRVVTSGVPGAEQSDLVRVWTGDVFDNVDRGLSVDYFLGRAGSATEDRGFHAYLSEFLGWRIPPVPTYGLRDVPLYLQVIFGLGYVDQKRGWGGTVPQVPSMYQIVEPLRKAVEFVLDLDVLWQSVERRELSERKRQLEADAQALRARLEGVAGVHAGRVRFPQAGDTSVPFVEVLVDGAWSELGDRIEQLTAARASEALLRVAAQPSVNLDTAALEEQLQVAEVDLREASARLAALNQADADVAIQLGSLARRLKTLEDEQSRYRQLRTLQHLGSQIAPHTMEDGDCPTCHQSLESVESIEGNALPVEATLDALKKNRQTVLSLQVSAAARSDLIAAHQAAAAEDVSSARSRVRALKTDLTAVIGTPSAADVQTQVEREQELARLSNLDAQTSVAAEQWSEVAVALSEATAALSSLGVAKQSTHDADRLQRWADLLRTQLSMYGFRSAIPSDVDLDASMKPVVDGYDIGFQGSASDGIRLRWAYLLSLMAACHEFGAQHPGILMLDEPGQQGVEPESLSALFVQVAEVAPTLGQIFVTTSEPAERIHEWLHGHEFDVIELNTDLLLDWVGA